MGICWADKDTHVGNGTTADGSADYPAPSRYTIGAWAQNKLTDLGKASVRLNVVELRPYALFGYTESLLGANGGNSSGFKVYNFEVEGNHSYFVGNTNGGVAVHNQCVTDLVFKYKDAGKARIRSRTGHRVGDQSNHFWQDATFHPWQNHGEAPTIWLNGMAKTVGTEHHIFHDHMNTWMRSIVRAGDAITVGDYFTTAMDALRATGRYNSVQLDLIANEMKYSLLRSYLLSNKKRGHTT
jgi:hypothetical protein